MPAIHVVPGEHGDWIVREDGGRELGHYPSQDAAKAVGHKRLPERAVLQGAPQILRDGPR
jgi:hypothetical protein